MLTFRADFLKRPEQLFEVDAPLGVEVVELALEERDGDLAGSGVDGEGQLEEVVLHGGDVVVHARVQEGQHYLLLDEGQPLHPRLRLPPGHVVPHRLGALEPAHLLAHHAQHRLHAAVPAAGPLLVDPLAQLLVPGAEDLEHQLDALGVLEDALLGHDLEEVPAEYLEAALDVGAGVLPQVEALHLFGALAAGEPGLPAEVVLHVGEHALGQQRLRLHVAGHQLEVVHQSLPHRVLELAGAPVAHPDVQPPASREHEHQLREAEVLGEGLLDDLDRDDQQLPALRAHPLARAAGPHVVVVVHVEVEDELALERPAVGVLLGHPVPDGAGVDLARDGGVAVGHAALHGLGVDEGHVALDPAGLVLEGEFAVGEEGPVVVGEPADDGPEGVQVVVVGPQFLLCHLEGNYYYK